MSISAIERKQLCLNIAESRCRGGENLETLWRGVSGFTTIYFRSAPTIQREIFADEAAIKDKLLVSLVSRVFDVYQRILDSYGDEELEVVRKSTKELLTGFWTANGQEEVAVLQSFISEEAAALSRINGIEVLGAAMKEVISEILKDLEKS